VRILQLITRDQLRGAEVFAAELAGALTTRGHEVTLTPLYGGPPTLAVTPEVRRSAIDGKPRPGVSPALVRQLAGLLREETPDVIQANGSDTLKYAVMARFVARSRTPLVYRNISMVRQWGTGPVRRRILCMLLSRVERVASVSEASRRDLLATGALPDSRVIVIPRGIPVPETVDRAGARKRLSALGIDLGHQPILFHVGSHTPEKNHAQLIQAFSRIRSVMPEAGLVVLGAGPLTGEIRSLIDSTGLGAAISLLGARADIADLLPAADLLLLPSHIEGIPGAVLEAAAVEVPAVAYDVGGVSEVVRDGLTGALVPHDDLAAFTQAVLKLLSDDMVRLKMGRRAREYVITHHSLEASAAAFEGLYLELIANAASRGGDFRM
jgi:glycosyltransferase involved in cell wall biosynthesis